MNLSERGEGVHENLGLSKDLQRVWPSHSERWQRSTTVAAGLVRRGKILLLLAAGYSHAEVGRSVGVQRTVIRQWATRVLAQRLDGSQTPLAAGLRVGFPPEVALHVVRLACERPDSLGRSRSQWDGTERARQLITEGIVEEVSPATARR